MEIKHLDRVGSTNNYAKEHIAELSDFTVVVADLQEQGRGRFDRSWVYNGKDNIYASIVLKPSDSIKEVYSNLTQYLCVVLAQVFEEYGVKPEIKWPNDILINSKKISGILAEVVMEKSKLQGIVLGFGVNLNCDVLDMEKINQPATSLNLEINKKVDKTDFLKKLLDKFCLDYNSFIEQGFLLIKEEYKKRANFLNKNVTIRNFDNYISGFVTDVTDNGALKIVDDNKREQILYIGDIL